MQVSKFVFSALCWLLLTAAKPLPEVGVATSEAPWLTEAQFAADPSLHATHAQTVVLELESTGKGKSAIRKNSVRFLVEEAQDFSFCIPDDEPHIRRIKLKRNGGPTVMNGRRGGACKPVELMPGSYSLDIFHDSRTLPLEGKKAFLHRPERRRVRLSDSMGAPLQEQLMYPNFFVPTAGKSPLGKTYYLETLQVPETTMFIGALSALDVYKVWSFSGPPPIALLNDSRLFAPWAPATEWDATIPASLPLMVGYNWQIFPLPIQFVQDNCNSNKENWSCAIGFLINDQGGGRFTMSADVVDVPAPAVIRGTGPNPSQTPLEVASVTNPNPDFVEFEFLFKAFVDASTMPPLQKGEFAVYGQCDFEGTAFVFDSDVDFAVFSTLLNDEVSPPGEVKSLKLGPSTFLRMTRLQSEEIDIGADIECESLAPGKFTIFVDALAYIAATNSCINCNLTGIDFSGDDFRGVDFSGAIFTDAILTGTNFSSADLTDANFSTSMSAGSGLVGTVFDGATLSCTSFRQADVTAASFDSVALNTDQSCYLNLSGATLDFDSFSMDDWRYLDLSSSIVNDVPQTLSTAAAPLDLSGAILSNVTWLKGKQLDSVNFGCYARQDGQGVCPTANGTKACTNLQNTALNSTSLKQACLSDASLEGALLNASNLDGADLSGAQLIALTNGDAATLAGAFMRGADLSSANLTGVDASHVNFYTGLTGLANAQGIQAAGASFANAYLAGTDFSGSGANLQGTDWSGAVLVGAKFEQSDLSEDTEARKSTSFAQAFMHGADFHNQQVGTTNGANFSNSYWDLSGANILNFRLPVQNLSFAGYWRQGTCASDPNQICTASTDCGTGDSCNFVNQSGVCKASYMTDPANAIICTNDSDCGGDVCLAQPECVAAMYNQSNAATPPTDASNKCPDTNPGGCDGSWEQPQIPISEANPPVAVDPAFPVAPGDALQCTSADFTWQLGD